MPRSKMFEPVSDSDVDKILAEASKPKRRSSKIDTSTRTVTAWFKLATKLGYCTVPSHANNVPEGDDDKYPVRPCYPIGEYNVCRWCFYLSADLLAAEEGLSPLDVEPS